MTQPTTDDGEEAAADLIDDSVPTQGYQTTPLVGLGGSAGAIPALQEFFKAMPADSGMAFVVVMHLAPEHESTLPELLQRCTAMPVFQAAEQQAIEPNQVYVIPPGKILGTLEGHLTLANPKPLARGRHVAVDLFLRALADTQGPHAAAVVLSGADGDGAIGIKRIKERGGLTVAQEPEEAEHPSMPRSAIATGMVDWVLPVAEMPARLRHYFGLAKELRLPPEDGPAPVSKALDPAAQEEAALGDVLAFLRSRTGRDFACYKRATVARRIARRMRVNGVNELPAYLDCLRTRPGEAGALLQDLLISVTNFFPDADCFEALDAHLGELFKGRGPNDTLRAWVPACATGEEAYSLAILLAEKARQLESPPVIQVFATDLDEEAIKVAREGIYPVLIETDVSEDRLRRYFSRLKLGRFELHRRHVTLSEVVAAALEATQPMLASAGHKLKLDLPDYPIDFDGDPLRLGQVLSNLLINAIKYTPGVGTIVLKARLEGANAVISVSDTGMGMETTQIERMFEMFAQAEPVADRSHGLGIGLALVKSIVELHGGRVEAFSPGPGKGSEFRVTLPATRGPVQPPLASSAPPALASVEERPAKKRGLILIADDNVDAGWGIAKLLEIAGFSTLRVTGGLEAVTEIRRHKPDVGIIDIGMPDLGGHEVARQIRQTEWGKRMGLIAATGWGQDSDEREAIEAGFDAHMTKPVDLRKLSAVVDELLERQRR
jgi:chemotaxis response regulator CheB/signal transduction histidine kinase